MASLRFFDCSNSNERPAHRDSGGPLVNDVMRYLDQHGGLVGIKRVDKLGTADVVVTNDVFTRDALDSGKPLMKRMDGVFWKQDLLPRNEPYNEAARQADHVVFITRYSYLSYLRLYGHPLKSHSIVLQWVDPEVFQPTGLLKTTPRVWAATATNWSRPEKRLESVLRVSAYVDRLILIGQAPQIEFPPNVTAVGYLNDPTQLASLLRGADAFVNLSYRDPATKTVCQAISCGLPVLYADSGGVREMVGGYGVPVEDTFTLEIGDQIPEIPFETVRDGIERFRLEYLELTANLRTFDRHQSFRAMLEGYAAGMRAAVETRKGQGCERRVASKTSASTRSRTRGSGK